MARRPFHLARRFFEVLRVRPLDDEETEVVRTWVGDHLMHLFSAQQIADQRHGYKTATSVARVTDDRVTAAAAALHDVGKTHSRLGPWGRTLATILMMLRVPMWGRYAAYRDHGRLGAADLEEAGAPKLVIEFARHHQHRRPSSIPADVWEVLNGADLGAMPRRPA